MVGRTEFRRSQGVVPFGVGAMTDFPEESLMMAGLDVWPSEVCDLSMRVQIVNACRVTDGRLALRLSAEAGHQIDYFLSPTESPPDGPSFGSAPAELEGKAQMPFVRFPNWYFCPRCRALRNVPWNTQTNAVQLQCTNDKRRAEGKAKACTELYKKARPWLSPVRFITACSSSHIMDFPWFEWAHSFAESPCENGKGNLFLHSTPAAGLAGVVVKCIACNSSRNMAGAFGKDALRTLYGGSCPGERPWLGPEARQTGCQKIPQTVQRGAANSYFAKVISSILIPPHSALLEQILDGPDVWSEIMSVVVDGRPHEPFLRQKAKNYDIDPELFIGAVNRQFDRLAPTSGGPSQEDISEQEYRRAEYNAFLGLRPPRQERHDFDTEPVSINEYVSGFGKLFSNVILVPKLRETRVLTGFSRLVPPEALDASPASLSLECKNWLPGFSVSGEGIFLKISSARLLEWLKGEEVSARVSGLKERIEQRGGILAACEVAPRPAHLMIHTLAHLLIRQLAFECGYDSSSLRERLYVSSDIEEMAGLLIYTASGDSEGTLGGLVRQGEPGRLDRTLRAALQNAAICSSDPLCIESKGQGLYSLNLSACHACSLLPETSCELGNVVLDRGLVIGTSDKPRLGYFSDFLES